jgi:hypothetical protein
MPLLLVASASSFTISNTHPFFIHIANADMFIGRNLTDGGSLDVSVEKSSTHSDPEFKEL